MNKPDQHPHVLVTGGAGYIGSHACKALARAGFSPVTYDNLERGHRWAVRWGPLEQGDILDRARLDAVITGYRPIAVMHFAAFAYVGESVACPEKYYRNNVTGSLTLLEALCAAGIDKLIFSSSCAVHGPPRQTLIAEDHPLEPINPYGATKLMIERMLRDFDAAHGLKSVSLRYFNAAGADPDGEIGEAHDPETHLIPLALYAAAGSGPGMKVFGDDYQTPDGTCIRDYIHVADLGDAHLASMKTLLDGAGSSVYNLGTGRGHSVREVLDSVRRVTGRDFPVQTADRRPGDPDRLVADASRIAGELDWHPEYTDLDEIIATAWRWHQRMHTDRDDQKTANPA